MKNKFKGIFAPMATALTVDGQIDEKRTRALVDFLIEGGIDGLFPLGTTGEFALLSREERRAVIDTVVDQTDRRVPVLAGVSDPSLENILAFAKDAEDVGADAIVATPPYYYSIGEEALFKYFEGIASTAGLPLVVYNIPEWTHLYVPPSIIQRLAEKRLIVGMKYTEYNLLNLLRFLKSSGDLISIFTGSDAMTFTTLEFGGSGGIIGVANIAPQMASRVFDEFKRGNLEAARKYQSRLVPLIEAISIGKVPAALKEAMKMIGMPVGDVKPPLQPLSDEERKKVAGFLREGGILKKGSR